MWLIKEKLERYNQITANLDKIYIRISSSEMMALGPFHIGRIKSKRRKLMEYCRNRAYQRREMINHWQEWRGYAKHESKYLTEQEKLDKKDNDLTWTGE